jgi:hypothetical protein
MRAILAAPDAARPADGYRADGKADERIQAPTTDKAGTGAKL